MSILVQLVLRIFLYFVVVVEIYLLKVPLIILMNLSAEVKLEMHREGTGLVMVGAAGFQEILVQKVLQVGEGHPS
jgi:hypothetical protein